MRPGSFNRRRASSFVFRLLLFFLAVLVWSTAALIWWSEDRLLDQPAFVRVVTGALRQEDSRAAIADEAWRELRAQFPLLKVVDEDNAEATIAALLERPGWTPLFRDSARAVYDSALAEEVTPVSFNLARDYPLLLEALLPFDAGLLGDLEPIPALGSIVLLRPVEIPHLGRWLPTPGWLAPALFLGGLAALIGVISARPSAASALAVLGGAACAAGLLLMALVPWLSDQAIQDAGGEIATIVTRALVEPWQESLRGLGLRLTLAGVATGALGILMILGPRATASLRRQFERRS
jgi:hypothetical protein